MGPDPWKSVSRGQRCLLIKKRGLVIDKPESNSESKLKSQSNVQGPIKKGKGEFGFWAVSKILWSTTHLFLHGTASFDPSCIDFFYPVLIFDNGAKRRVFLPVKIIDGSIVHLPKQELTR